MDRSLAELMGEYLRILTSESRNLCSFNRIQVHFALYLGDLNSTVKLRLQELRFENRG
jgi:hypothetical protein